LVLFEVLLALLIPVNLTLAAQSCAILSNFPSNLNHLSRISDFSRLLAEKIGINSYQINLLSAIFYQINGEL